MPQSTLPEECQGELGIGQGRGPKLRATEESSMISLFGTPYPLAFGGRKQTESSSS